MQVFTIRNESFASIRDRALLRTAPLMMITVVATIVSAYGRVSASQDKFNAIPVIIPLAVISMGIGIYADLARKRAWVTGYKLMVSEDRLILEQQDIGPVTIRFKEITGVSTDDRGNLFISNSSGNQRIMIPAQLENFTIVQEQLKTLVPFIHISGNKIISRFPDFPGLLSAFLLLVMYKFNSVVVILVAAFLLVLLYLFMYLIEKKERRFRMEAKKTRNWSLFLIGMTLVIATIRCLDLAHIWPPFR